ncbi:hypothetical protein FZC33_01775 [Labrys sp. KNU-23]|uniref:hypothetical protein n=1 Tax=Labrys sp. KNU-23 TaxID=2789216 RepID=UPI0011ED4B9F|nr:hypothetical protein [Labrys sp. KNU-23]QEN85021.1 hypothetical protein FZC33_01775 [Labrys sp. KNU-23]
MPYRIVRIDLETNKRKVLNVSCETQQEAFLKAQHTAEFLGGGFEYNQETKEWLATDFRGRHHLIFLEEF